MAGVAQGDQPLAALLNRLCTETACWQVGLAVSGWATVGVPVLLVGAIVLLARPSIAAQYAMLGCVALLSFAVGAVYAWAADLRVAYPTSARSASATAPPWSP